VDTTYSPEKQHTTLTCARITRTYHSPGVTCFYTTSQI